MLPLTLNFIKTQWKAFITAHPLLRGSITYAILWPTSSTIQQTFEGKNFSTYDYKQTLRFCLYGSLFVAPTLYGWVRLSSAMWPQMTLKVGLIKAATEQISYGPFACCSFFLIMSLLEGKNISEGMEEVKKKFLPTFKVGVYVWPILQTMNFSMVPEKHRVVFVSICSLLWTTFLAYMKRKELTDQHYVTKQDEQ